jgi:hypothetical protein
MDQSNNNMNQNLIQGQFPTQNPQGVYQGIPSPTNFNQQQPQTNQVGAYQYNVPIYTNPVMHMGPSFAVHSQYIPNHFNQSSTSHVVRCLPPSDRQWTTDYAYVKCPNVTTCWVSSYGFSYLTSFSNDQNYFFVPRTENGFTMETWNESATKNKLSRDKMNDFFFQLNSQYNISQKVKDSTSSWKRKRNILTITTFVLLAITVVCLVGWINELGRYRSDVARMIIFLLGWIFGLTACCIVGIFAIVRCYSKAEFSVDKEVITATGGIENFFNNWNSQYFLQQGCYVMAPRNLRYIQFVLDSNIKFSVEDHAYPYDIIPRGRDY